MIKNILIASATKPKPGYSWDTVFDEVRKGALQFNCVVMGGIVTHGPGCINMGLKVVGINEKNIDIFGKALCMAFMPAKWCDTPSEIKDGFIVELD